MTQIKEHLEKQPSEDLISMIKVAGDSLLSFGELWGSIKKKGHSEGFSEKELQEMLRPYLKEKLDSKKVWYLFHAEEQKDRSKQQYQNRTNISTNDVKKDTEQTPTEITRPRIEIPKEELEEEPTELELANIKIAQLEDALHKTEQFKPATALQPQEDDINSIKIRAGIGAIENLMRLEIPKLRNRGWKTVEITMRAV
jgi:hypothetical protein